MVFGGITAVLAIYGVKRLDTYFALYTMALLALAMFYMSFSARARRALSLVSVAAFVGFLMIAALQVVDMASKR
ncbi:MAG: hypothetical protein AAB215_00025 [Planctomycetota bacterium]